MSVEDIKKARAAVPFNREQLESVLRGRFFYAPAFDLYGGVSGLYDYGPPGCAFQNKMLSPGVNDVVLECTTWWTIVI